MNNVPGGYSASKTLHSGATATANGAALVCDDGRTGAKTVAIFDVSGVTSDTITFKGRVTPDTDYVAIKVMNLTTGTEATTATADGIYRVTCLGLYDMIAALTYVDGDVTVIGKFCA